MNTPEDETKDPVWELLKKSRPVEPGPFFSRNVIREVRQLESDPAADGIFARLSDWLGKRGGRRPVLAMIGSVAALAVAALVTLRTESPVEIPSSSSPGVPVAKATAAAPQDSIGSSYDPATEISNLDYLGELMAVTDPSLLDDNALADLLF